MRYSEAKTLLLKNKIKLAYCNWLCKSLIGLWEVLSKSPLGWENLFSWSCGSRATQAERVEGIIKVVSIPSVGQSWASSGTEK